MLNWMFVHALASLLFVLYTAAKLPNIDVNRSSSYGHLLETCWARARLCFGVMVGVIDWWRTGPGQCAHSGLSEMQLWMWVVDVSAIAFCMLWYIARYSQ